ncbi:hypothetical protein MHBO_004071 [Bonamia ostreae]|uniref:Dynein heavy chain n=1 Tax=Bonamia ostreae TaxID=126728 RepID=A0ABV2ASZ4_9EUKA
MKIEKMLIEKTKLNKFGLKSITLTPKMMRLFNLVLAAIQNNEPVLLVGGPGNSKTTICQVYKICLQCSFYIFLFL